MALTETQLILLSAASQHEDGLLVPPDNYKRKTISSAISKLLRNNLVEELVVRRDEPHWREDEENCIGLKLTPMGLQALGIEPDEQHGDHETAAPVQISKALSTTATPREGSKKALVISLLRREHGATLDDLVTATGWLPHSTRAALTGLRQSGHAISSDRNDLGKTVYRLKAQGNEASASEAA